MPSFITGLQRLIQDATKWVGGLGTVTMILMVSYHALMRTTSQDQTDAMRHARSIRNVLKYGVIVVVASVLVNTIVGYF